MISRLKEEVKEDYRWDFDLMYERRRSLTEDTLAGCHSEERNKRYEEVLSYCRALESYRVSGSLNLGAVGRSVRLIIQWENFG